MVNHAGFATSGNLLDNDLNVELAMLHVNSRAPLILSHHFGRRMREQDIFGQVVKFMQFGKFSREHDSGAAKSSTAKAA